jgi:thiol-disulfide isomerase/thioredoxin
MRNIVTLAGILLFIVSCAPENSVPSVSGETDNVYDGLRVYLKQISADGTEEYIDTAIVADNKFDFGILKPTEFDQILLLELDTAPGYFTFLREDHSMFIQVVKDSLYYSTIEGGNENESFSKYRTIQINKAAIETELKNQLNVAFEGGKQETIDSLNQSSLKDKETFRDQTIELISGNPNKLLAPIAVGDLFKGRFIDEVKARELYNRMGDQIKNNPYAVTLDKDLKAIEASAIGHEAPYFEGKSPEGRVIKLPEVLGKVTLVDFWASWCAPCRQENPNIAAAYKQFHDKGFHVISISLEKPDAKDQWIAAIKEDQMDWNHISRLAYWNDPIARQYNVSAIPASFLLDENGIIIDKNVRGKKLQERLSQLLD